VPDPVLSVQDVTVEFNTEDGVVHAVTEVSYDLFPGETLGIVGESGSGKSVSVMSMLGLIPVPPGKIVSGQALYQGRDLLTMPKKQLRNIRGGEVAMIFQDPMTSLNPVLTIGDQIAEAIQTHHPGTSDGDARKRVVHLLEVVGVPSAERRFDQYPHEFSGGMRQRAMIAMAIANDPAVLIADEPTTALDVTIQAQVLALLADLQAREGLAVLLITHNLGVVASVADRVMVMYGGDVVESGPVKAFFRRPTHPYSEALLAAMPRVDRPSEALAPIPGQVPTLPDMPSGCRYQSRCPLRIEKCAERPPLNPLPGAPEHRVRCWVRAP
jgi:peptide/nickel transport system ATP-binding protein